MEAYFVKDGKEALEKTLELIKEGDTVAFGGSMTLAETGILNAVMKGNFRALNRYSPDLSPEERQKMYRDAFFADVFLTSANAVTENGELINVDGNANRVSAILFGPKSVITVVGKNKIVKNILDGFERVKKIAAPKNTKRLNCDTYCREKGVCIADGCREDFANGCKSPQRICCDYAVCGYQREKNRIKVIIIDEDLGY